MSILDLILGTNVFIGMLARDSMWIIFCSSQLWDAKTNHSSSFNNLENVRKLLKDLDWCGAFCALSTIRYVLFVLNWLDMFLVGKLALLCQVDSTRMPLPSNRRCQVYSTFHWRYLWSCKSDFAWKCLSSLVQDVWFYRSRTFGWVSFEYLFTF